MMTERSVSEGRESGPGTRRRHSVQFKRRVVREVLELGASAREVARRHGLHESLIGAWRRLHSQGRLQEAHSSAAEAKLLAVQVPTEAAGRASRVDASIVPRAMDGGAIHIEFSHGHRLSVRGEVDGHVLSAVIRELSRS